MNFWRLIFRNLVYYRRANVAVVLGAAVGVAVITGSLAVGDSVTGSLRDLAVARLGRTAFALTTGNFFRESLAADLARPDEFPKARPVPAVMLEATASDAESETRVPQVTLFGVDRRFGAITDPADAFGLPFTAAALRPATRAAAVSRSLADDLNLRPGSLLLVTFVRPGLAAPDSLFGRRKRTEVLQTVRLNVARVLPEAGAGQFSLKGDRPRPRNVFVSLEWLQEQIKRSGLANVLFVPGVGDRVDARGSKVGDAEHDKEHTLAPAMPGLQSVAPGLERLNAALARTATIDDYGLRLLVGKEAALESREMVLSPEVVAAAEAAAGQAGLRYSETSIYLANNITRLDGDIRGPTVPYSVVAAGDFASPFAPLVSLSGSMLPALEGDGVVLNQWTADQLGAAVGDTVTMSFYRVAADGSWATFSKLFTVRGIAAMTGAAVDRTLVPQFEGLTDAPKISDWRPPFPIDLTRIRDVDEAYWKEYGPAPKAFISAAAMRDIWAGGQDGRPAETGWVTSVRLAAANGGATTETDLASFTRSLTMILGGGRGRASVGHATLAFIPVRQAALAGAAAATDYGSLLLGLSSFLVLAAALLVALLVRLSVETRARQVGLLLAVGFTRGAAARLLLGETMVLIIVAVAAGVPLGVVYARGILWALATMWTGAVGSFPLTLHVEPASLAIGGAAGFAVAALAAVWAVRVLRRGEVLTLLGGWRALGLSAWRPRARVAGTIAIISLAGAATVLVLAGFGHRVEATTAFFISGSLLLVAGLAWTWVGLRRAARQPAGVALTIPRLARRYAARQPVRSLLTVGLLAAATFIIVTVAANRQGSSEADLARKDSGAGGFALVGDAPLGLPADPGTAAGRRELGFDPADEARLAGVKIYSLPVQAGDDASCLNMQRPLVPRVVGLPELLIGRGGFSFAEFQPLPPGMTNPWELLNQELPGGEVPAIGDEASVRWILHSGLGGTITVPGPRGDVHLRIVGLLRGSIWQSELLVAQPQLERRFGTKGYRRFLIEGPQQERRGGSAARAAILRYELGDFGFDLRTTGAVLAGFEGVQNAYLSSFETLGGLGLALGAFGLVTVLLRNVAERRSELALLLALGFGRGQVVRLVVAENAMLTALGLGIGLVAGLMAAGPHLVQAGAAVAWAPLAASLAAVLVIGLGASMVAARQAVGDELITAIRAE